MTSTRKVYSTSGSRQGYSLGTAGESKTMGSSYEDAVPHNGVSYQDIKKQCLSEGVLFEDPDFPAVDASMFFSKKPPRPFEWKRPKEIVQDPQLFVGGASKFDVTQGMLGDCWLLAAIAGLSLDKYLLDRVIPPDQSFQHDYAGIFRFRFWQYGRWEEVSVDDRLPTYNGKLVFVHSSEMNEFWSALLEKAYAKLCGSYEALKGGQTSEAMEDFTGGVTEVFDLTKDNERRRLFDIFKKAYELDSQMGCSIEAKPNEIEAKLNNGLVKGHAYTITDLKTVNVRGQKVNLIKIRNPWGNEREWTGAWSDGSAEWGNISESDKKDMALENMDDGEFWMAFNDFKSQFTRVEICNLSPDSALSAGKKGWATQICRGTWQNHVSAGGCRNFPDTFWTNPQYAVCLEADEEEDDRNATVIIALMQKGRRKQKRVGAQNLTIGFAIYEDTKEAEQYRDNGDDRLNKDFFLYHKSTARSVDFVNSREICGRFRLPEGSYVIVPSTFKNNEEGDFVLRIFSLKPATKNDIGEQTVVTVPKQPSLVDPNDPYIAKLKGFFDQVAGSDEEINAWELQRVLSAAMKKELEGIEFALELCKSIVAVSDYDRTGKLGFEEFAELFKSINWWKGVFNTYDKNRSGCFNAIELRSALLNIGYKLSTKTLGAIVLRYADENGQIKIDSFIACAIKLRRLFQYIAETFPENNASQFDVDNFLVYTMYS